MMKIILDQERLKILRDLALIDSPTETIYDRLTELASKIVGAPISLVSMVGGEYQFFKSSYGLGNLKSTPLSHSFCKHVVATHSPLIVTDAREDPIVKGNGAIVDLDVISYLGMPMTLQDGKTLGSFCVIDHTPRTWTSTEIDIIDELSQIVTNEIDLRAMAHANATYMPNLEEAHKTIHQILDLVDTSLTQEDFLTQLRQVRSKFQF
jgi:GAF domain-containing protein